MQYVILTAVSASGKSSMFRKGTLKLWTNENVIFESPKYLFVNGDAIVGHFAISRLAEITLNEIVFNIWKNLRKSVPASLRNSIINKPLVYVTAASVAHSSAIYICNEYEHYTLDRVHEFTMFRAKNPTVNEKFLSWVQNLIRDIEGDRVKGLVLKKNTYLLDSLSDIEQLCSDNVIEI